MTNKHSCFRTGFGDLEFIFDCNNGDAYQIAQFLFADFPGTSASAATQHVYDIIASGPKPMLSLWQGEKKLYYGNCRYQLAYILMNEVIYHCITANDRHLALHAGAVCSENRCILLPGKSGKGKSTLTGWLIANGFQYLTDELVFLTADGHVIPLTRPINLKVDQFHETWPLKEGEQNKAICSEKGSMIPHRLLNNVFSATHPLLTDIIFPEFKPGCTMELSELSPAKSSLYLLQSHVNARNLNGHGIPELAAVIRKCRSFRLIYGSFSELETIFNASSSLFR